MYPNLPFIICEDFMAFVHRTVFLDEMSHDGITAVPFIGSSNKQHWE